VADHIIPLHLSLPTAIRDRYLKASKRNPALGDGETCAELEDLQEGLGSMAGFKCIRLIGLAGYDNHNRLWFDEEIFIHVQLVKEAVDLTGGSDTMPAPQATRYAV